MGTAAAPLSSAVAASWWGSAVDSVSGRWFPMTFSRLFPGFFLRLVREDKKRLKKKEKEDLRIVEREREMVFWK